MSAVPSFDPKTLDCISSEHYERNGYPFAEWAWLRKNDPVSWITHPEYDPFWAITKHADIIELSKQPTLFLNDPRLAVFNNSVPPPPEASIRHLLNMDPPDHAKYRNDAGSRNPAAGHLYPIHGEEHQSDRRQGTYSLLW